MEWWQEENEPWEACGREKVVSERWSELYSEVIEDLTSPLSAERHCLH